MSDDHQPLDAIEERLRDLRAAEDAGVFSHTRVNPASLVREAMPTPTPLVYRVRPVRWVQLAAAIGIAAVVWTWMYASLIGNVREGKSAIVADASSTTSVGWDGSFTACLTGPADGLPQQCRDYDLDADGDVDLADYGAVQLAYAGRSHTR